MASSAEQFLPILYEGVRRSVRSDTGTVDGMTRRGAWRVGRLETRRQHNHLVVGDLDGRTRSLGARRRAE
jgi:hypothetical protein